LQRSLIITVFNQDDRPSTVKVKCVCECSFNASLSSRRLPTINPPVGGSLQGEHVESVDMWRITCRCGLTHKLQSTGQHIFCNLNTGT
ncbi:hypothetical protein Tsubulata_046487, partial [Turnera subulata]